MGSDAGTPVEDASIAVLPFADLSPAGDQEYFSDDMADEILNALVKVDGLQVASSRTSSFGFKGRESLGIKAIAGQLAVRHVLEGSVRRAGGTIRITAQLIDAEVDRHLWSDTFHRPLAFKRNGVSPIVAKVLFIGVGESPLTKISGDRHFLAGQARRLVEVRSSSGIPICSQLIEGRLDRRRDRPISPSA